MHHNMAWKAKVVYEEMINDGVPLNQTTYGALLHAYYRGRYKEDNFSVYKEIKKRASMWIEFYITCLLICVLMLVM